MAHPEILREGAAAPMTRIFGWATLGCLLAFMINNVLTVGWDYPGAMKALSGGGTGAIIQLSIYLVCILAAVLFVLRTPYRALRWDAMKITNFNAYLVRAFFFTVLFVGIVDVIISFMRVENLLENRVDVFYAGFGATKKGFVNAVGTILLGMTTAWVIIAIGFAGKQSIINSPVKNFEVSQTGGTGMFIKYQMAAFIGIFAITMLIQFVSYLFEAVADKRGEQGRREVGPVAH